METALIPPGEVGMDRSRGNSHFMGHPYFDAAFSSSALAADKYSTVVRKAREIIELNDSFKVSQSPETAGRIAVKLDRLVGFLLTQFSPHATVNAARRALSNEINALDEHELAELHESEVPLAVIRELASKQRVYVNPRSLHNWNAFIHRYKVPFLNA